MRARTKKWLTATMAAIAVGIWVPQIFTGVVQTEKSARPEVPNFDSAEFDPAILDPGPGEETNAPLPGVAVEEGSGELSSLLVNAAEGVEGLKRTRERVDLDQLLQAFHDSPSRTSEPGAHPLLYGGGGGASPGSTSSSGDSRRDGDPLHAFVAAHRLNAVIDDGENPLAMIGSRLVRVGDTLPNGMQVAAIARRSVELTFDGRRIRMELPPFEAREPSGDNALPSSEEPADGTVPGEMVSRSNVADANFPGESERDNPHPDEVARRVDDDTQVP